MNSEGAKKSTPIGERSDGALRLALIALFVGFLIAAGPAHGQEGSGTAASAADENDVPAASAADSATSSDAADALAAARRLADSKQFAAAAATLREGLQRNPDDPELRSLLARVLAWDRKYDESIAEYELLLTKHPDRTFDRAGYARVLAWSGRHETSIREFRRAIAADSTNLETRVGYARALSWAGDRAGAHVEYRRILRANPAYGDAWLGYATIARWRGAATASDRFTRRAAATGADAEGLEEEETAAERAMATSVGGGYVAARERQYVDAAPDFVIESSGPFVSAGATISRAVGVNVRGSWLVNFEDNGASAPGDTALNYDLRATVVRADVSFLRGYPLQFALGAEHRTLDAGSGKVLFPLAGDDDFFGWNARAWWHAGRFTPSLSAARGYVPIKSVSGAREILAGDQTTTEAAIDWQWNARGTARLHAARGSYSDDNERTDFGGGAAYKVRLPSPSLTLDYGVAFRDFDQVSTSYFTPLESARHAVGLALNGYSDRAALDYGLRYEYSLLNSDNFDDIRTHTWTGYWNIASLASVPLGVDGSYSIDNNDYESWYVGVSGSVRW